MDAAKKRWKLLSQLLQNRGTEVTNNDVSVRRFQTFGLITCEAATESLPTELSEAHDRPEEASSVAHNQINSGDSKSSQNLSNEWKAYSLPTLPGMSSVLVKTIEEPLTKTDVLGFNNTGNICIWPAEEILAYFCLKNINMFKDQTVCEIGGGMTCLAGLLLAANAPLKDMLLTDGNVKSVKNVCELVKKNLQKFGQTQVQAKVLRWDSHDSLGKLKEKFDKIICADCFFFKDCQENLVKTLFNLLTSQGEVISFAPRRGETLQEFVAVASSSFDVTVKECYDETVSELHNHFRGKGVEIFDDNLHYPILVQMVKRTQP